MTRKIDWQNFGSACDYGRTGVKRVTYWLRYEREVCKITPATPSAYGEMERAHYHKKPCLGYEGYAFGPTVARGSTKPNVLGGTQ